MCRFIQVDPNDNVATALQDTSAGDIAQVFDQHNICLCQIKITENIPLGNKVALPQLEAGAAVIKYGFYIGTATARIKPGELVHVHNVSGKTADIPPAYKKLIIERMGIQTR